MDILLKFCPRQLHTHSLTRNFRTMRIFCKHHHKNHFPSQYHSSFELGKYIHLYSTVVKSYWLTWFDSHHLSYWIWGPAPIRSAIEQLAQESRQSYNTCLYRIFVPHLRLKWILLWERLRSVAESLYSLLHTRSLISSQKFFRQQVFQTGVMLLTQIECKMSGAIPEFVLTPCQKAWTLTRRSTYTKARLWKSRKQS